MKDKIFTVATAHLDTSWLWTQEETIKTYIPRTLKYNFKLFEKFPEYKFNFEGSYRYELIEEYYPEEFKILKKYIDEGRFCPCGSCFENGDTNIVSPESLIRNILYGNSYFKNRFNIKTNDIFLPDCFGFGKALPQVMTHSGLIGFSTQKLSWGSSYEPPFEFGKWTALDNSYVLVSLKPGPYGSILNKPLRDKKTIEKIDENRKYNLPFTMYYHGTGDRGGSPRIDSVKNVIKEQRLNNNSNIDVISASINDMFNEIDFLDRTGKIKLESFDKEFLMTEHGSGSYTSRTQSKRLNKRCENLLDTTERINVLSNLLGVKEYPKDELNFAWKRVIEHHFHDDITGTSFMECYKRNWNDYYLALNTIDNEYKSAIIKISEDFNTSIFNQPVLVFNPNQDESIDLVSIPNIKNYKTVKVIDSEHNIYPSSISNGMIYFSPFIKGNAIKVFDIIESEPYIDDELKVTESLLENNKYKVVIDENFNIKQIYDKELNLNLLKEPIEYQVLLDIDSVDWPSWEVKYSDIVREPIGSFTKGTIEILDNTPTKVSLLINKEFNGSKLKTIISLTKGSNRVDIRNILDWSSECSMLKIKFNTSINNDDAFYDIGLSKYARSTNTIKRYEVPAQKFASINDNNNEITIISDSRTGWDKPDESTLRLTIVHSPMSNYRHECSQHLLDFGINEFSFSITSNKLSANKSIVEADKFTKELNAFYVDKHNGRINNEVTLVQISNNDARIMAFYKSLNHENKYVLRVVDYFGNSLNNIKVTLLNEILSLEEIDGTEEIKNKLNYKNNEFEFSLKEHEIKSFLIGFKENEINSNDICLDLDYTDVGITSNENREDSTLNDKISLPIELLKDYMSSSSIKYKFNLKGLNAIKCNGQKIKVNKNYKYAYLLLMNQEKDKFININNKEYFIQSSFERLYNPDMIALNETGFTKQIPQAFAFTHHHKGSGDVILGDCYLYSIKIEIDNEYIVLPNDPNIVLYSITLSNFNINEAISIPLYDRIEKREFNYKLSKLAIKKATRPKYQKFLDIFFDRIKTYRVKLFGGYTTQGFGDLYSLFDLMNNKKLRKKIKGDKNEKG